MKVNIKILIFRCFGAFLSIVLCGCMAGTPVRHFSSDVCLVMPESTTREEVVSFLGKPDRKKNEEDQSEVWLYYKANSSFLRKLPLVGDNLGSIDYETITVTFTGDQVRTCIYRQLDEKEFEGFAEELD